MLHEIHLLLYHVPSLHSTVWRSALRAVDLKRQSNDILNIRFNTHFSVLISFRLTVAPETISLIYLTLNSCGSPLPVLIFSVTYAVFSQLFFKCWCSLKVVLFSHKASPLSISLFLTLKTYLLFPFAVSKDKFSGSSTIYPLIFHVGDLS